MPVPCLLTTLYGSRIILTDTSRFEVISDTSNGLEDAGRSFLEELVG
jgi:hypothetical protein